MNRRIFVSLAAGIVTLLSACLSGASASEEIKAQQMVDMTVKYFEQNGAEATIAAVNAGGSFRDGELYVFMISPEGISVANPTDGSNLGKNVLDLQDEDGVFYGREIMERATAEGEWVHYKRLNPATGEVQPKLSWVRRLDGYVIGCGVYMK